MANWTNGTKTSTTFSTLNRTLNRANLLIESTYKLMIGDGFFLDIEPTFGSDLVQQSKSSTSFANQTKN